ncbi:FAD-dependent monooxygenase [Streptomyces sp. 1331.2]|uniref:FAD-dependent monooxygenase n=1 Tax=Streptomyces sp. 1331.2 TaxID=1938835 RepID=UPI000BD5F5C4|nr:FAD-dependent monooxygenase [Streptomyces sp. 1331.2]SOB80703.1 2-polyprenyl-6-methoxyphenol hydroxylase [Streptomyces sp. 1331.2]
MKTVLISGGGIAGTALAALLSRRGFAPTVVERAPGLRGGGQAVDIRGVALEVVERLGVLERARAHRTRMRGMTVLDGEGREVYRSTESTISSGRLDSDDIELLRDDLVRILHERATEDAGTRFVFGDAVTALDQDEDGVRVSFAHAGPRRYDLVVGADGLHSAVRRLAFGPEERFARHLGTHLAIFSADNFLGLEDWQLWLRDGEAGYGVYPVRDNSELRIAFGFAGEPLPEERRAPESQKALVAERMAALRWETPRLLKALAEAPDLYCDSMTQIRMDRWSRGRVVLLGDAGYCASPLSGQGTSLALVGAHVLADALAEARTRSDGDHRAAFAAYEQRLRPFVELNQALATENPGGPAAEESVERAKNAISLDD